MLETMTDKGLLRVIHGTEVEIARQQALRARAIATLNERPGRSSTVPTELALTLSTTEGAAKRLVEHAETLTTRLPETLLAMEHGTIDWHKAVKICDATSWLDDENARSADRILAGRLTGKSASAIRRAAGKLAEKLDTEGFALRSKVRRAERKVTLVHRGMGTAALVSELPVERAAAIYRRIDTAARELNTRTEKRTLDQLRADVFTNLCLGKPAQSGPASRNLRLRHPAHSGRTDHRTRRSRSVGHPVHKGNCLRSKNSASTSQRRHRNQPAVPNHLDQASLARRPEQANVAEQT